MSFNIINTEILKYKSDGNLFVGLVTNGENSDDNEILSAYQNYIEDVLGLYVKTTKKEEVSIENEIKSHCQNQELNLSLEETDEMLGAFNQFFLFDMSQQKILIERNVKTDQVGNKFVVRTADGNDLVEFEFDNRPNTLSLLERFKDWLINKKMLIVMIVCVLIAIVIFKNPPMTKKTNPDIDTTLTDTALIDTINPLPIDKIDFKVIDALQTEGQLILSEDTTIELKYYISTSPQHKIEDIDWNKCKSINPGTILYPKETCTIYLRANSKQSKSESIKTYEFNICNFIEMLIKMRSDSPILNQMFAYTKSKPLTIEYDQSIIDICKSSYDKGFLDNLKNILDSGEVHIDSISFYGTNHSLESKEYPLIKYINCKSI